MNKLKDRLEICANVCIILLAIVLTVMLVRIYWPQRSHRDTDQHRRPIVGSKLLLDQIDFSKADKTALVAVSTRCHFCMESAPFYQKLIEQVGRDKKTQIFFLFPRNVEEGKQYLEGLNLRPVNVTEAEFVSLQIGGTPTVMLADSNGNLTDVWVGKLPARDEEEVLTKLKSCVDCR